MEFLVLGIAMAFNFAILKIKFDNGQYLNFLLDIVVFMILSAMLMGTLGGMVIATVASAIFSLFLLISPVKSQRY